MSLTREQMRDIRALSDTKLYQEAIEFLNELMLVDEEMQKRQPLPNTQMNGLLNLAQVNTYHDLFHFVEHQRTRTWQGSRAFIGVFYGDLQRILKDMPARAEAEELLSSGLTPEQAGAERRELAGLLACEFIQHLAAENAVRERARQDQEKARKEQERKEREQRRSDHD